MKTLTVTAIAAIFSLSGTAFAAGSFWSENAKLLTRYSNPHDDTHSVHSDRIGGQPQVGSAMKGYSVSTGNFFATHGNLLIRNSNHHDDPGAVAASGRIGGQPEVGSASIRNQIGSSRDFWKTNGNLLVRNSNGHDDTIDYNK